MKKILAALAMGAMLPATVLAAYTPGTYTAKLNLNIRSTPSMSGALIDHYLQGDTVNVLEVLGSWCRVSSKYAHAYVYCSILAPGSVTATPTPTATTPASNPAPTTPVVTNGLVTQSLKAAQNWLLTNNEGVDYINNSFFKARDAALVWDGAARLADFYFQWPLMTGTKCSMIFSGTSHAVEAFNSTCFDAAGNITTSKTPVTTPEEAYDLPVLPFKTFIADLMADKALMAKFDTYFSKATHVDGLFRLYKDVHGTQLWEGKFIDNKSGYFMTVSTDASKLTTSFIVKSGMFQ